MIAFLGLVGQRKGIDVLLDALALLSAQGVDFTAVVGGNGEVDAAIESAARLGLGERVSFLGWVDEDKVDAILRQADIFVLPSRAENQPISILEAMARGVPVVSTLIGAIPEQVIDGETGLLVQPGDASALAAALASLINSPELRDSLGQAGLLRFQEHFSVAACAEKFAALYRKGRIADR